jgi:hypothetical protein
VRLTPVLTAALLFYAATAHAQGVSLGAKAGFNIADLSSSSEGGGPDSKTITGVVGGLFVTVPVNDIVALQVEGLFSQQGTKATDGAGTYKIKIDYFQLPLLARIKLMPKSPVSIVAGPSLGFRTGARLDLPGAPVGFADDFEDFVERFDAGLVAGVAVEAGHVLIDGRYTWGLLNVFKDFGDVVAAKNRVFSATIGLRF